MNIRQEREFEAPKAPPILENKGIRLFHYSEAVDGKLPQEKKDELIMMLTSDEYELSLHPILGDKDMVFYAKNKQKCKKLDEWVKENIPTAHERRY